ncbi:hypothetical protein ACFVX3_28700 [Rhodococcus erythropolis]
MNQAQTEPVVHEVIIQSSTPWHIYIAAVIGGLIAIGGWFVVHRTSQSRDLKNWQRSMIIETVSDFLEISDERFDLIVPYLDTRPKEPWWDKEVETKLLVCLQRLKRTNQKILMCASETEIANETAKILLAHTNSYWGETMLKLVTLHHTDPDREKYRNTARMSDFHIRNAHNELLRATQKELGQKQTPAIAMTQSYVFSGSSKNRTEERDEE